MRTGELAVLLLAAGGSSRLGRPKQLLRLGERTLVRRAVDEALESGVGPVLVVLGAHADEVASELDCLEVETCFHPGWERGMASSIQAGLRRLLQRRDPPARVLILLCDQPDVDRRVLRSLVDLHARSESPATACVSRGLARAPAVFEASLFEDLLALRGDRGAREILRRAGQDVALLPCPAAETDIDTEDDAQSAEARWPK